MRIKNFNKIWTPAHSFGQSPKKNPSLDLKPECGIAECITERVNGRVDVAEAVGDVPDY